MYQALGIIALLFGQAVDLSLTAVLATGLITLLCCQFDVRSFLLPDSLNQHFGFAILVLTALCAGFQVALAKEKETEWFTPRVKNGKRGRKIVGYYFREMTIVPLILLLPLRDGTQSAFFGRFQESATCILRYFDAAFGCDKRKNVQAEFFFESQVLQAT